MMLYVIIFPLLCFHMATFCQCQKNSLFKLTIKDKLPEKGVMPSEKQLSRIECAGMCSKHENCSGFVVHGNRDCSLLDNSIRNDICSLGNCVDEPGAKIYMLQSEVTTTTLAPTTTMAVTTTIKPTTTTTPKPTTTTKQTTTTTTKPTTTTKALTTTTTVKPTSTTTTTVPPTTTTTTANPTTTTTTAKPTTTSTVKPTTTTTDKPTTTTTTVKPTTTTTTVKPTTTTTTVKPTTTTTLKPTTTTTAKPTTTTVKPTTTTAKPSTTTTVKVTTTTLKTTTTAKPTTTTTTAKPTTTTTAKPTTTTTAKPTTTTTATPTTTTTTTIKPTTTTTTAKPTTTTTTLKPTTTAKPTTTTTVKPTTTTTKPTTTTKSPCVHTQMAICENDNPIRGFGITKGSFFKSGNFSVECGQIPFQKHTYSDQKSVAPNLEINCPENQAIAEMQFCITDTDVEKIDVKCGQIYLDLKADSLTTSKSTKSSSNSEVTCDDNYVSTGISITKDGDQHVVQLQCYLLDVKDHYPSKHDGFGG